LVFLHTKLNRSVKFGFLNSSFFISSIASTRNPENKHVNVKGEKSPFDGDIAYWSERNSKLYDGETSKILTARREVPRSPVGERRGRQLPATGNPSSAHSE